MDIYIYIYIKYIYTYIYIYIYIYIYNRRDRRRKMKFWDLFLRKFNVLSVLKEVVLEIETTAKLNHFFGFTFIPKY